MHEEADAALTFEVVLDRLRDSVDALLVFGEIAAIMGQPIDSCPLCGERLGSLTLELEPGYVDGTAEEEGELAQT